MRRTDERVRVLYSFPLKLGANRICYTAWEQVAGLAAAGAQLLVFPGALHRPVPTGVTVRPTLARGGFRIPYKLLGERAGALHDWIVARRLEELADQIDIIHTWPSGALRTLNAAARLGIPTVLERPNAHTRFALAIVQKECQRLGVSMPAGHEHGENPKKTLLEEAEFQIADRLLCPSDFVVSTFLDQGYSPEKLVRHQYGFDQKVFFAPAKPRNAQRPLTMLFVGGCAPRKGLHYALEAWLKSPAHVEGQFLIAGKFIPGYAERLSSMLSEPSVKVLGHRQDAPELMRSSDLLVLPSIEEGSALVTSEARGSGCVLLVSNAAGALCTHMENALVHQVGDVTTLSEQITLLHENRSLLESLRENSLRTVSEITWSAAGLKLLAVYRQVISDHARETVRVTRSKNALSNRPTAGD